MGTMLRVYSTDSLKELIRCSKDRVSASIAKVDGTGSDIDITVHSKNAWLFDAPTLGIGSIIGSTVSYSYTITTTSGCLTDIKMLSYSSSFDDVGFMLVNGSPWDIVVYSADGESLSLLSGESGSIDARGGVIYWVGRAL